ncbi:MAG: transposase [Pseudomonadota bacterium]
MRFLGFNLGGATLDENTIRHFRNRLTETGTLRRVMKAFDWQLQKKGYIPPLGDAMHRLPGSAWPARSSMRALCRHRSSATLRPRR